MADAEDRLPISELIPLNRVRKAMAKAMSASVGTAALSQVSRCIDVGPLVAARAAADPATRVSINTYVMAATARLLPAHPFLNGRLIDTTVHVPAVVNLGMAVATDAGLLVPVIHRADEKSLAELDAAAADLAQRARAGALRMADIDAGTFTVSNLGMLGIDTGFALPPPPQAAILLVGRSRPRLELGADGDIVTVTEAAFGVTYDHRFIDGAGAAAFLADLASRLATIAEEE
ncbi:MAG TPA: 2-oxo acid dehydrogenase subunit E2 [Ilumatobacteraceae bacterium]|nr:2-oxo acid dehydrogenase subunit E2 [Ilumatobacteraceae bacterium]HRB01815.1 2-oxo acid dehydrogenase subunit E2 [Ilumatobacteraceae bacterium]